MFTGCREWGDRESGKVNGTGGRVVSLHFGCGKYKLRLNMEAIGRFFDPPAQSFFLFGPRGTGKSTWIRSQLPGPLTINLLDAAVHRELAARPERLRAMVLADTNARDVVIDEVQRAPELLHVVHDLIESPHAPRFILTGSSARKLRRGGVDLLGGRAVVCSLHPFMAAELPQFDLDDALSKGMVPLVIMADHPDNVLRAYAALYLQQEVQSEALVRNAGAFARFLEIVSFSHASVINMSEIAREAQVGRRQVEHFVGILEDLLVATRLPVFTKRAQRATVAHPKFYLFDAGVYRSLRPRGPLDRPEEIAGAALEGLVMQHLLAWIAYANRDTRLYYWRTRAGSEVDFIVYGPNEFWAVEVKHSDVVRAADLRALRTFVDDYPEATPLFLYRGRDTLDIDGIRCIPVDRFLRGLHPARGLPSDA